MNDLTGLLHEAYALRILPGERAVLRAIARFDVGRMVADYERLHLRLVDRAGARSDPYREELVAAHDRGRVRS